MTKLYTVVGIATDKHNVTKVRYANNLNQRVKILLRDGFTNINFIQSDTPKPKLELCKLMLDSIEFQNNKELIIKEQTDVVLRMDQLVIKREKINRKQILSTGV